MVGDFSLKQLSIEVARFLLDNDLLNAHEVDFKPRENEIGFVKMKVIYKKNGRVMRLRRVLDFDDIQDMELKEFCELIVQLSYKHSEKRYKK